MDMPSVWTLYHRMAGFLHLTQHNLKLALDHAWQAKNASILSHYFEDQILAMQLLLRVLLEFYLLTKEETYGTQVEGLVEELLAISKEHHLHVIYVESLLVSAFLRRAAFDVEGTTTLLNQVEQLAEQYGLRPLQEQAQKELAVFQEQLAVLQQLQELAPDAYKQSQMREMMAYLKGAQRIIDRENSSI
jgi:hypothetical protein